VLFFPKPMVPANLGTPSQGGDRPDKDEQGKTLKGVEFVSQDIFAGWLNNVDLAAYLVDENLLHGGDLWVTPAEREALQAFGDGKGGKIRLWEKEDVPRVAVDRVTSKSAVYQAGRMRYRRVKSRQGQQRSGLWVLVEWPGGEPVKAELDWLANLFAVLGDSGLGGERTAGYGQYDLEGPVDFAGFGIEGLGERWLTLSPYHPRPDEVGMEGTLGPHCAYRLLIRRGWVGSPEGMSYRRPYVRVLSEGAVLHHPFHGAQHSYGDLADVTPTVMDPDKGGDGHKVWRYGIAFPVPVGIPADGGAQEVGP
jgi:CRISPR type III-A-associated RAMP protein Csm4